MGFLALIFIALAVLCGVKLYIDFLPSNYNEFTGITSLGWGAGAVIFGLLGVMFLLMAASKSDK